MIIYSYIDTEELCKLPLGGIYRHSQKAQQLIDSLLQLQFSYSSFFERDVVESLCSILLSIKKKKKRTLLHVFFHLLSAFLYLTGKLSRLSFHPYSFPCHLQKEFLSILLDCLSS